MTQLTLKFTKDKPIVVKARFIPSQHYPDPKDRNTCFRNIKPQPNQVHPTYYQVWKGEKEFIL